MPAYVLNQGLQDAVEVRIAKYYSQLQELKIQAMFREETMMSAGRVVAGMTVRPDDRNWLVHQKDVIIEFSEEVWKGASDKFRDALVDHELCHVVIRVDSKGKTERDEETGRIKVSLAHHDIEEFNEVLQRHGAYHAELRTFLRTFERQKEESTTSPSVT